MDADYIRSMPIKPHDQTSNQAFVDVALAQESNKDLVFQVATEMKGSDWLAVYTRIVRKQPSSAPPYQGYHTD